MHFSNRRIVLLVLFAVTYLSCQKTTDFTNDINDLRQQIQIINSRLDSLTNAIKSISGQLTTLDNTVKNQIQAANLRIDSISTKLNALSSTVANNNTTLTNSITTLNKSILGLIDDMTAIKASIKTSDLQTKSSLDSIQRNIDSTKKNISKNDSLLKVSNQNLDSANAKIVILNTSYTNLLNQYLSILNVLQTQPISISGVIEKGPFSKGSIISFFELDNKLSQTGKSYASTINDNNGNYQLNVRNIAGNLVRVQTDGFYYNEILNTLSTSRIVLTGISKIDSNQMINVNVLTHLERRRVEYLMTQNGLSFDSSKKQAIKELLNIFEVSDPTITRSEKVNLFGTSSTSDILLNISTLFEGLRSDAQLSELLTDFANDFYLDGKIDSTDIMKQLYNHALFIDSIIVAKNVKNKFNYTTKSFSILKKFISKNVPFNDLSYQPFVYPSSFSSSTNFLRKKDVDSVLASPSSSIFGYLYVTQNISNIDFKVIIRTAINARNQGVWFYNTGAWTVGNFNYDDFGNQSYYEKNSSEGQGINFNKGTFILDFYEPSTSPSPTFTKRLIIY